MGTVRLAQVHTTLYCFSLSLKQGVHGIEVGRNFPQVSEENVLVIHEFLRVSSQFTSVPDVQNGTKYKLANTAGSEENGFGNAGYSQFPDAMLQLDHE
jgi:hypothetical protein